MKRDKSVYSERYGFTLVEMLIVIAIIGILMGMLIPSLSRAKENARRAECASNLHQLQCGMMSYLSDSHQDLPLSSCREYYDTVNRTWGYDRGWVSWEKWKSHDAGNPSGYGSNPPEELRTYWWGDKGENSIRNGALFPYIEDVRVYICPSFKRYVKEYGDPKFQDAKRSYVMSSHISGSRFLRLSSSGMSRRMMFADGAYEAKSYKAEDGHIITATWGFKDDNSTDIIVRRWNNIDHNLYYYYRGSDGMLEFEYDNTSGNQKELIGDFHHGKGNVVFIDGHTECLSPLFTEDVVLGKYEPGQK